MKTNGFSLLLAMTVAGCGGGGGSGSSENAANSSGVSIESVTGLTGSYQYFGYVEIIQDTLNDRVNHDANFLELTAAQPADVFRDSIPMSVDTCSLEITDSIPTDVGIIGFPNAAFNFVSAGETLTLTQVSGTYATIDLSGDRFDIAPYPAPDSLTLDVPGNVFPAFTNVSMPDVIVAQNFRPRRNENLLANTQISWTPTGLADHTLNLQTFDIYTTGKIVNLRCHVADDGAFVLPASIVSALNTSLGDGFELEGFNQVRRSDSLYINGNALLVVSRSISDLSN